ncbi:hypothetical protein [Streptomyces sp. NBC_00503]|uniref:hypothetical protein n=1 Tax=Streptomyces sp. NBC_00503 TaxID=2903659 RepID=UPI002E81186A|nr:hypothetical protein [Streptomyces sp. NBC_00503]WUD79193.1 hypothetical protein OG490_00560 [Streptomyces sp. NBC_00503]
MPRTPRYLLIWLSCTAASVTAVLATVQFVVGSTRHTPPVARSAPVVIETPPAWLAGSSAPDPASPSATAAASTSPAETQRPSSSPTTPSPAKTPPGTRGSSAPKTGVDCEQGGAGLYTVPSEGGKVTVRYGSRGVCLISAVPGRGFKTTTSQTADDTLTVTFTSGDHRSVITATVAPEAKASVRETSY